MIDLYINYKKKNCNSIYSAPHQVLPRQSKNPFESPRQVALIIIINRVESSNLARKIKITFIDLYDQIMKIIDLIAEMKMYVKRVSLSLSIMITVVVWPEGIMYCFRIYAVFFFFLEKYCGRSSYTVRYSKYFGSTTYFRSIFYFNQNFFK